MSKEKLISYLPLVLVSLFALLRGVTYYNYLVGREVYLKYDEAIYALLSQKLLNGEFSSAFNPYWNSGFPLVTIPFYLITGHWEISQILVSVTSHLILIFVMYFTLKRISHPLAFIAAFITAFSPSFQKIVIYGGYTEPLFALLYWLAVYFAWKTIISGKISQYILSGLFFGLAYLTRTEIIYTLFYFMLFSVLSFFLQVRKFPMVSKLTVLYLAGGILAYLAYPLTRLSKFTIFKFLIFKTTRGILFALPFALAAVMSIFFERNKTPIFEGVKKLFPKFAVLLGVFLFVNLPYIYVISNNLGKPTLSGKYSFIGSAHPFTPEKDRMTTWAQDIWSLDFPNYQSLYYDSSRTFPIIWKTLDSGLEDVVKKINTNLNFYAHNNIFSDIDVAMMLLGIILALFQPKFRKFAGYLLVLWTGSFVMVSYFMDVSTRYLVYSFSYLYIAQAFLVLSLGTFLSGKKSTGIMFIVIAVFTAWFYTKNFDRNVLYQKQGTGGSYDQIEIANWLKSQKIDLIMARTEGLQFYSGAKIVYMPAANPETIIKFAKAWGVEYLVARPHEASWDYMRIIVDPKFKNPDLKLIHEFKDGTLIWKAKLTEDEKLHNFRTTKDVNEKHEDINVDSQTILK